MRRSLSLTGPLDEELISKYIIPALGDLAWMHRHDDSSPMPEGWVGRAKVCELAAAYLVNLLGRNKMMCHMVNTTSGRRRVSQADLDTSGEEWLAAMEREMDKSEPPDTVNIGVKAAWQVGEKPYPCVECGTPIEAGDFIGYIDHKGICHKECEAQPQQFMTG